MSPLLQLVPDFRGLPRAFWVLIAGTLVNRAGGFVLVFLAIYLTEVRGLTPAQAGAIVATYGIGALAGGPLGGALSDRIGRRPTLVASLIGGGLSMFVLGLVRHPAPTAAAAMITGLLYELYRPVVSATIADVVDASDRPRAYSLMYWAINVGASLAPILGALIAVRSYLVLFAADAATTMLYGVIVWAGLPETRPAVPPNGPAEGRSLRAVLNDHAFLAVCGLTLTFSIVFFQSFVSLPIDMRAHGISTSAFGALIALNAVLVVILQPMAGQLIRNYSRLGVMAAASLLLAAGVGMNAWIGSVPWYAAAITIWTLGEILFSPASMSLVADMAPPDLRGRYQGMFAAAFTGAFALAPAIGGLVIERAGAPALWIGCLTGGVVAAVGFAALERRVSASAAASRRGSSSDLRP